MNTGIGSVDTVLSRLRSGFLEADKDVDNSGGDRDSLVLLLPLALVTTCLTNAAKDSKNITMLDELVVTGELAVAGPGVNAGYLRTVASNINEHKRGTVFAYAKMLVVTKLSTAQPLAATNNTSPISVGTVRCVYTRDVVRLRLSLANNETGGSVDAAPIVTLTHIGRADRRIKRSGEWIDLDALQAHAQGFLDAAAYQLSEDGNCNRSLQATVVTVLSRGDNNAKVIVVAVTGCGYHTVTVSDACSVVAATLAEVRRVSSCSLLASSTLLLDGAIDNNSENHCSQGGAEICVIPTAGVVWLVLPTSVVATTEPTAVRAASQSFVLSTPMLASGKTDRGVLTRISANILTSASSELQSLTRPQSTAERVGGDARALTQLVHNAQNVVAPPDSESPIAKIMWQIESVLIQTLSLPVPQRQASQSTAHSSELPSDWLSSSLAALGGGSMEATLIALRLTDVLHVINAMVTHGEHGLSANRVRACDVLQAETMGALVKLIASMMQLETNTLPDTTTDNAGMRVTHNAPTWSLNKPEQHVHRLSAQVSLKRLWAVPIAGCGDAAPTVTTALLPALSHNNGPFAPTVVVLAGSHAGDVVAIADDMRDTTDRHNEAGRVLWRRVFAGAPRLDTPGSVLHCNGSASGIASVGVGIVYVCGNTTTELLCICCGHTLLSWEPFAGLSPHSDDDTYIIGPVTITSASVPTTSVDSCSNTFIRGTLSGAWDVCCASSNGTIAISRIEATAASEYGRVSDCASSRAQWNVRRLWSVHTPSYMSEHFGSESTVNSFSDVDLVRCRAPPLVLPVSVTRSNHDIDCGSTSDNVRSGDARRLVIACEGYCLCLDYNKTNANTTNFDTKDNIISNRFDNVVTVKTRFATLLPISFPATHAPLFVALPNSDGNNDNGPDFDIDRGVIVLVGDNTATAVGAASGEVHWHCELPLPQSTALSQPCVVSFTTAAATGIKYASAKVSVVVLTSWEGECHCLSACCGRSLVRIHEHKTRDIDGGISCIKLACNEHNAERAFAGGLFPQATIGTCLNAQDCDHESRAVLYAIDAYGFTHVVTLALTHVCEENRRDLAYMRDFDGCERCRGVVAVAVTQKPLDDGSDAGVQHHQPTKQSKRLQPSHSEPTMCLQDQEQDNPVESQQLHQQQLHLVSQQRKRVLVPVTAADGSTRWEMKLMTVSDGETHSIINSGGLSAASRERRDCASDGQCEISENDGELIVLLPKPTSPTISHHNDREQEYFAPGVLSSHLAQPRCHSQQSQQQQRLQRVYVSSRRQLVEAFNFEAMV